MIQPLKFFFSSFQSKNPELDFIKNGLNNNLFIEHSFHYIQKLLNLQDKVKIYKSTIEISKILDKVKKLKHIHMNGFVLFFIDNKLHFIIEKWEDLINVIEFIGKSFISEEDQTKIDLAKLEVEKSLSHSYRNKLGEISSKYPNFVVKDLCIEIYHRIVPERFKKGCNVFDIPKNEIREIEKLSIFTDPSGRVTSLKISNKNIDSKELHPNADKNGWYCLGELKYVPLNREGIDLLIANLKIYNLDDCYWKPKYV